MDQIISMECIFLYEFEVKAGDNVTFYFKTSTGNGYHTLGYFIAFIG